MAKKKAAKKKTTNSSKKNGTNKGPKKKCLSQNQSGVINAEIATRIFLNHEFESSDQLLLGSCTRITDKAAGIIEKGYMDNEDLLHDELGCLTIGITNLSDAAAKGLSKCISLHLENVKFMSDASAKHLSLIEGSLSLPKLKELTLVSAKHLSKSRSEDLFLGATLSVDALKQIARFRGERLGILVDTLTHQAAKTLSRYHGRLTLTILSDHSDSLHNLSRTLVNNSYEGFLEQLDLRSWNAFSPDAVKELSDAEFIREIHLGNADITPEVVKELANCSVREIFHNDPSIQKQFNKELRRRDS